VNQATHIARLGDTLLVSVRGDLDDETVARVEKDVAKEVARSRVWGMVIDASGLTVVEDVRAEAA
jgi:rsbT antagonist protein RsbS